VRFADFFCGAGGLSLGFRDAGHTPVLAVDFDKDSIATYHENFCGYVHGTECHCLRADVLKIDPFDFPAADIYIGGPPCQGFSVAGKQDPNDLRNQLPYVMLDFVKERRPTIVLIENVPGAVRMGLDRELLHRLSLLGYCVDYRILNAADYGVPQTRKRMFVQARLDGPVIWPKLTHCDPRKLVEGLLPWVTAGEALDGLLPTEVRALSEAEVRHNLEHGIRNVIPSEPSPTLQARDDTYIFGTDGETLRQIRIASRDADKSAKVTFAKNPVLRPKWNGGMLVNGRGRPVNMDTPSPTIPASAGGNRTPIVDTSGVLAEYHHYLTGGGGPKSGTVVGVRRLTVAECAALQSFPPEFRFMGSRTSQYKQVGNAVPPLLARRIGENI